MKKLDVQPPAFVVSPASFPDLKPASRLIVLVPDFEADPAFVAQKIHSVAKMLESRIQLIGLSKDAMNEPSVRRRLVALSAMIADTAIFVEANVEIGNNWLHAVLPYWHQGDVIVCFAEQNTGFGNKPLYQILQSNLNATIYVLSGIQTKKEQLLPRWALNTAAWIGSTGLILGFFWLQVKLSQPPQNWFHTILMYGSILAEAGAIWVWNNLFR